MFPNGKKHDRTLNRTTVGSNGLPFRLAVTVLQVTKVDGSGDKGVDRGEYLKPWRQYGGRILDEPKCGVLE